ncbi:H(+)-transporting V1 sector ATPase subunit H [Starmerella bacillaris]|uniref:V-type proton ATPase subunit H n=1 Tax=Starmerella bacillaris TaxID=1247836 RepID=A0AAV5RNE9_STABA|nr:H(+)-transporting V1 sector ATPase subunit H [Starmerella bacillaris]
MIRNPILDEVRNNVDSRPIPWKGLNRANIVTEDEVQSFESLGKLTPPERLEQVRKDAPRYAGIVAQILSKDGREDLVKYLVLFIAEYSSTVPAFADSLVGIDEVWHCLAKMLTRGDEQIATLAAASLAALTKTKLNEETSTAFFDYVVDTLLCAGSDEIDQKDLGAQLLATVLQNNASRVPFRKYEQRAVPELGRLALTAPLQLQYSSLLVLWILSFDKHAGNRYLNQFNIVPTLLDVAQRGVKEKIVRLCIATLANLVRLIPQAAIPVIIAEGAMTNGKVLPDRKWNDEELQSDLDYLNTTLVEAFDSMTTFEEYLAELQAHKLRWSPVHRNRAFWMENIDEFRKDDWAVLKRLVALALQSKDNVTLAVACHDIAAIVHQNSDAVQVISRAGGKVRIMELIGDSDNDVRYEALRASQVMLQHILA